MKLQNIVLGLTIATNVAIAQVNPKVETTQLGSSARVVGAFSQDLALATRTALPSYDDQALGSMIEMVAKKYANGLDPLEVNLNAIESLYEIKVTGEGEVQERDYGYQISKKEGRIYLHKDRTTFKPYSLTRGATELRMARQTHPALLKMFGIDKSQFSSFNSNLILLEGIQKMANGDYGRPKAALVDNVYSYAQRAIEGIMVDGSYVKVLSKDARTNEGLIINWPRFQIHPGLLKFDVKSKTEILDEALVHLKRVANPKNESNIKMAVVFRPVMMGETRIFIPSMKIGLYSRPVADTFADDKGENGDLFYVDLMKQALTYTERADQDVNTDKRK